MTRRDISPPTRPEHHISAVPGQFIAAIAPEHNQVLILLKHPAGGTWTVQTEQGSPAIGKLEVAADTPPAKVSVKVRHLRGTSYSLAYSIGNYVRGTRVRLVERGRDSTHVLGTVSSAAGTLRFTPQDALSRARRIVAYLLNSEGATVRALTVGHYTAPGAQRPGRPSAVKIVRRGLGAVVSWRGAAGARVYAIVVRGSDGRLQTLFRSARQRSVTLENVLAFESFSAVVRARGGPNLLSGPAVTVRLAPLKPVKVKVKVPKKKG